MMSDIVACPSCERKLRVRHELQGQSVKCPACNTTFTPAPPEPAPAPGRRHDPHEDDYEDRPRRSRHDDNEDDDYDDRPVRRRRRDWEPHRGVLVLALGICGLMLIFWPITSLVAWILGSSDLREIRAGRMDPEGESMTRIGMILGIVGTLLFVMGFLFLCLIIAAAVVFSG